MPCDRIYLQQIDWKLADPDVLKAALARAGFEVFSENAEGLGQQVRADPEDVLT